MFQTKLLAIIFFAQLISIHSISLLNAYNRMVEKERERDFNIFELRPVATVGNENVLPRSSIGRGNRLDELTFDENGSAYRVPISNLRLSDLLMRQSFDGRIN